MCEAVKLQLAVVDNLSLLLGHDLHRLADADIATVYHHEGPLHIFLRLPEL